MGECAGSCGITSQRNIVGRQPNPLEDLKDCYDKRQLVKQEIRKNELSAKGEKGELSTKEAMELAGYKIQEGLEKMAKLTAGSVCYMA